MIVQHSILGAHANTHHIVDDFGTLHTEQPNNRAWWSAFRFANVVSFEECGMRSFNQAVSEH
jgi:hypothetical protein